MPQALNKAAPLALNTKLHIGLKSYSQPSRRRDHWTNPSRMKLIRNSLFQNALLVAVILSSPVERTGAQTKAGQSGDSSWPREKYNNGTKLIIYQPQVDDWKDFKELTWRMAISLTPKSGKEVVGVVEMKGNTDVDNVAKVVDITNPRGYRDVFSVTR